MADQITLPSSGVLEIIYKDVFNMKSLYAVMHLYLEEENWVDVNDKAEHQFIERYYLDKKMVPREIRFWWRAHRGDLNARATGNPYYTHYLDISANVINMVDVEIIKEGKKMKVQNGEISIKIIGRVVLDDNWPKPSKKWSAHPLLRFATHFLRHRLYKEELEQQKRILYRDMYRFHAMIKKYLELRIFTPEFEVFHEKFENM